MMESKATSSITSSRPSLSAMALAISASMPTILSPSWYSYGGKVALVAIVSLPAATVLISAFDSAADVSDSEAFVSAAVVVSEAAEEAAGVLEHEARPKQNEAAMITDISLRVKGFITKSPFSSEINKSILPSKSIERNSQLSQKA